MPEIVIITDKPGSETINSGGILGKYAEYSWNNKNTEESPYVIFTSLYDYQKGNQFITKQRQIKEIEQACKILKFNWEILYEGRKYYNGFYNTIDKKDYCSKLKNSLDFLQPRTVISTHSSSDNDDLSFIYSAVCNVRRKFKFNHIGSCPFGINYVGTPNQYIGISPSEIDRKYKAMLKYNSIFGSDVFKIKSIIDHNKNLGNRWGVGYVEPYFVYESFMEI